MPLGLILFLGLVLFAASFVLLLFSMRIIGQSNKAVRERLEIPKPAPTAAEREAATVIRVQGTQSKFVQLLATGTSLAKIERNVLLAGRPDGWTARRVLILKVVLTIGGIFVLFLMVSSKQSLSSWGIGGMAIFIGYVAPETLLQKRAEARQESIQLELPDVLDQVTISIESGLSFETAFAHIGERRSGPLAEEIVRTVQDMRLGMSRRDAYQAMAARTEVEDLRRFVKSIVQAEQYGVSVSSVVKTQATEIRFKRRKRAEARALKVPVKIVFPLLVCILPVLFIVILTPAIVSISENVGAR